MGKSKYLEMKLYLWKFYFIFKDSMEKFNQLARRFSSRKDGTMSTGKYSKQPM